MYTNTLHLEKTYFEFKSPFQNKTETGESFENRFPFLMKIKSFRDRMLIKEVITKNLENIANPSYKIGNLARDIAISQRHLERKIKKLTGFSAIAFRREIRLQKAFQLLTNGYFETVAEVRFEVGLEHPSYFAQKFQERFGSMPNEVLG